MHVKKTEKNQASSPEETLFSVSPGAYYFMYEGNSQIELKRFTSVYWHAIQSINQSVNQSINKLYLNTVNGSASWFSDLHLT